MWLAILSLHPQTQTEPEVTSKEITGKTNKITSVSVNKFQLPNIIKEDFIITMVIFYCCLEEVLSEDTSNTKISSATW